MRFVPGRSRRARRLWTASLLSLGAGVLYLAAAVFLEPLHPVQNTITDALFQESQGSRNIAIVAIGDDALDRYGRLGEWPRSLHGAAIQKLHQAGALVIVYDVLFADEGQDDEPLAQAISEAGNVVLPAAGAASVESPSSALHVYGAVSLPVEPLRRAAVAVAHANVEADSDGQVRRIPLGVASAEGDQYPALSLAAFYLQFGRSPPSVLETSGNSLSLIGRSVPLEDHRTMRINYVGGTESFSAIPFTQVVTGDFDDSLVEGKVVFVGLTATGADSHSVPLLGMASGVEIHANALDTLFRSRFLEPVGNWVGLAMGLLFAGVAGFVVPRWRVGYAVALVVLLSVGYLLAAAFTFYQGRILDSVNPPAALVLATMVGLVYRALAERAAQQEVGELFGRYVSKEVAGELLHQADRDELQLGGVVREVSVLFADIRGFTPMSEGMDPGQLVELLNRQFEVIVAGVLNHGGIVNKFLGDAIMALWNAPHDQPDHAFHACRAAMAALDELESLASAGPPIRFGFGINTGPVLAGNVGTAGRLEYTVVGETANIASRLSGGAAGGEIWIGEQTCRLIRGRIEVEELPAQHLRGMAAPVAVFRLRREVSEPILKATRAGR